jgi:hypothetical protein
MLGVCSITSHWSWMPPVASQARLQLSFTRLAKHKPTLFLDEYSQRLHQNRELSICITTIHRSLERAGLNVKHVQKMASERDPILCADFICRIGQYPAHYLLSIDEVSKDDRTYTRLWGHALIGRRAEQHAPFVHKHRYSMIVALVFDEGIVASRVLEGSFTHETFLEYLHDDVVGFHILSFTESLSHLYV